MMMKKRLFAVFLVLTMLSGCGTSLYYAEFIYPSKVFIPAELYKVGYVNRAGAPGETAPIFRDGEVIDYAPGIVHRTTAKVANAIEAENESMGRYNVTRIDWDRKNNAGSLKADNEITAAQADSICLWELVDGVIIAEGAEMELNVRGDFEMVTVTDDAGNMVRVPEFTAKSVVTLTMRWRFYDYVAKKFLDDYEQTYTYTLSNITYSEEEAMSLNPRDVSTLDLANIAAVDYYARIAPYWMEDYRVYYQTGNSEMYRIATDLEYDGDWEKAAKAWTELSDDSNDKVSHRARFNLAVAAEMLGQPKMAKTWLERAKEVRETKESERYMKRLEDQILLHEVVMRQLGLADDTDFFSGPDRGGEDAPSEPAEEAVEEAPDSIDPEED